MQIIINICFINHNEIRDLFQVTHINHKYWQNKIKYFYILVNKACFEQTHVSSNHRSLTIHGIGNCDVTKTLLTYRLILPLV